ncbi:glycosyltransferase [Microbacterium sp. R86528]|uniref:glycosyltransferase n=1 Tax=Microbacterium sp. R86528 TaxID=3093864 RepID=UPI0037C882E7
MSIVVPAHNEGALVAKTLRSFLNDAYAGEFEVIVVANGCSDDTAAQARAVPGVRVIEIATASKIAALNAGDLVATSFPRAYIDSDVSVSVSAVRDLRHALASEDRARVASPQMVIDSTKSSWPVRAYYRVWEQSDYLTDGHIGSGIYAVNASGRSRWDEFPDLIADDRFVQQRFTAEERIMLDDVFVVTASRSMSAHIRRGVRIERGNQQLPSHVQRASQKPAASRYLSLLRKVGARPALWPSLPVYLFGFASVKLRARRDRQRPITWARDSSSREAVTR